MERILEGVDFYNQVHYWKFKLLKMKALLMYGILPNFLAKGVDPTVWQLINNVINEYD